MPDVVLFGNEIYSETAIKKVRKKSIILKMGLIDESKAVASALNISVKEQDNLIKRMFRKNKGL